MTKSIETLRALPLPDYDGSIVLRVSARGYADGRYTLAYSLDGGQTFTTVIETANDHLLSRGYTGAYLGLYATSNGRKTGNHADFDEVSYQARER